MRLATFRDVEIAMSRVERELGKLSSVSSSSPATNTETIIEKTTITEVDSFQAGNSVIHKLIHRFRSDVEIDTLKLVTLAYPTVTDTVDLGTTLLRWRNFYAKNWSITADLVPTADNTSDIGTSLLTVKNVYAQSLYTLGGSASLPVKTNSSKQLITQAINLASSTEVTGTLPVGKGGTGLATLTSGYVLTGNGTSAVSLINGLSSSVSSIVTGITYTTKVINYKDHSSTNQTATLLDSVSIATSTGLTFTSGVLTNVV